VIRIWIFIAVVVAGLGGVAWANDFITMQGESTIYTAQCEQGSWSGTHCSGRLATGPRYRFRALKTHREVIFWTVGATEEPSGKLTDCTIHDGRNWVCKVNNAAPRPITREMVMGRAVPDPLGQPRAFHPISKSRWMLLRCGVAISNDAKD